MWTEWRYVERVERLEICGQSGDMWTEWRYVDRVEICRQSGDMWREWGYVERVEICGQSGDMWTEWRYVDRDKVLLLLSIRKAIVFLVLGHSSYSFIYINFMFLYFNVPHVQYDILQYYLSAFEIVKKKYRGAD
jgi:hypothetical protein